MNHTTVPSPARPDGALPESTHTPLSAIDPRGRAAVCASGRVAAVPGRRTEPITFNSAI